MNRLIAGLIAQGFSLSLVLSAGGQAFGKEASRGSSDRYPTVVAVLDYSQEKANGQQADDDAAADALFRDLDRMTIHRLSFQHTRHMHAPTEITIGDRAHFPFQTIICTSESHLDKPLTKLVISGHFVVSTGAIPTANSYLLFPFPGQ